MMILKWKCDYCNDIKISKSNLRHQMDFCQCGKSAVDLEEEYTRFMGSVSIIDND